MNHYCMDELEIGKEERFTVKITEDMQETFMKLTGDINPMHIDEEYSKRDGFNGRIVYGMLTASFYSTLVGVYLPGERCLFHECDVAWKKPVYIGDELTIAGQIKEKDERFRRVIIKAYIVNQDGIKVSKATLVAGVR
jgi:3-hydroxybutyryl-CoA dehydratase